jgi:GNAT superfamily N-acetyltransferase
MISHLDRHLAQRLERADVASNAEYVRARQTSHPASASDLEPVGDGVALFAGLTSPIVGVFGLGMGAPVDDEMLVSAEEFLARRGVAPTVHVCPLAEPSLIAGVRRRGYRLASFKHVWVQSLADSVLPALSAGKVVVAEALGKERELWARVVSYAFEGAATLDSVSTDVALPNAFKPNTRCFLAWSGGQSIGGGALAIHDGVGICFSTSIHPAFRRMGAQTALLTARFAAARAAGCDLMLVHTAPNSASQRNIERFGFSLAYTRATVSL